MVAEDLEINDTLFLLSKSSQSNEIIRVMQCHEEEHTAKGCQPNLAGPGSGQEPGEAPGRPPGSERAIGISKQNLIIIHGY